MYPFIDSYLSDAIWPEFDIASSVIGCAFIILVVIIAQVVFWATVAYGCSEERLGLYAHVQGGVQAGLYWVQRGLCWTIEWLFFFSAGLFAVIRDAFQLLTDLSNQLNQLCASERPQATDTGMTPPPHYSLYDNTEDSIYRLSNVDEV
ncbi:hypothetical protein P692DRAFT_20777842, partial [Suillus brevipes Sb2]